MEHIFKQTFRQTKELREPKKVSGESLSTFPASVPRAGVEPARVAPLVFETSASTDSAIWATYCLLLGFKRCKDTAFCDTIQILSTYFFEKMQILGFRLDFRHFVRLGAADSALAIGGGKS